MNRQLHCITSTTKWPRRAVCTQQELELNQTVNRKPYPKLRLADDSIHELQNSGPSRHSTVMYDNIRANPLSVSLYISNRATDNKQIGVKAQTIPTVTAGLTLLHSENFS